MRASRQNVNFKKLDKATLNQRSRFLIKWLLLRSWLWLLSKSSDDENTELSCYSGVATFYFGSSLFSFSISFLCWMSFLPSWSGLRMPDAGFRHPPSDMNETTRLGCIVEWMLHRSYVLWWGDPKVWAYTIDLRFAADCHFTDVDGLIIFGWPSP